MEKSTKKKAPKASAKSSADGAANGSGRVTKLSFLFLLIVCGAFFLRIWQLEIKPVHFDEGINGHFVASIWRNGFYHYDPTNFHGPLYFYLLQLSEMVFGWGIFGFRLTTVLIQIATLFVIGKHKRFVGRAATGAALILALSPAFVFYGRYAIHESLFIFGQAAFSYGYFLYRYDKSVKSIWWMGLAVVVLITTKETFFIFLGTWAIAALAVNLVDRYGPTRLASNEVKTQPKPLPLSEWSSVIMVSVLLVLALFTGFFMFPQGASDMFTALQVWTKTGTAKTGHEKVFLYWFDLFRRYEWPILVSLVISPVLFFTVNRSLRILVLTGFGTWLAYSLIPYKTPWLVLNLIWPLAFAGGAILSRAIPAVPKFPGLRTAMALAMLVCIGVSTSKMWKLNFHNFAARGEPYVYVQSTLDFKKVVDTLYRQAAKHPESRNMKIAAANRDTWPLPYLLIPFTNVQWGRPDEAALAGASVVLSDGDDRVAIETKLTGKYFVLPFQIRDSYQDGQAYLEFVRFRDVVPASTETFERAMTVPESGKAK